jgi:hypothetical protein
MICWSVIALTAFLFSIIAVRKMPASVTVLLITQLTLEFICLSKCQSAASEILALRQQGGGFLPCILTFILRI